MPTLWFQRVIWKNVSSNIPVVCCIRNGYNLIVLAEFFLCSWFYSFLLKFLSASTLIWLCIETIPLLCPHVSASLSCSLPTFTDVITPGEGSGFLNLAWLFSHDGLDVSLDHWQLEMLVPNLPKGYNRRISLQVSLIIKILTWLLVFTTVRI